MTVKYSGPFIQIRFIANELSEVTMVKSTK